MNLNIELTDVITQLLVTQELLLTADIEYPVTIAEMMITIHTGIIMTHLERGVVIVLIFSALSQGSNICYPNWVRLAPNGTNLELFKISFSTFWRWGAKMY